MSSIPLGFSVLQSLLMFYIFCLHWFLSFYEVPWYLSVELCTVTVGNKIK